MKMTNIFGKNGSLLVAGALVFTIASCDTDTRSNQSIVREAENQYETETDNLGETKIIYDDGEYADIDDEAYDYNQEYAYEDRDVVIERVNNDLNRAERRLTMINQQIQQEGENLSADAKRKLSEARQNLEQTRRELSQDLEKLERSTEANWENVRNDANESLRGLEEEWLELKEAGYNYDSEKAEESVPVNE